MRNPLEIIGEIQTLLAELAAGTNGTQFANFEMPAPLKTASGKLVQIIDIPTLMPNGDVEMVRETLIEGEESVKNGHRYVVAKNAKGALYRKSLAGQLRGTFGGLSPRVYAAELQLAAVKQLEETNDALAGIIAADQVQEVDADPVETGSPLT